MGNISDISDKRLRATIIEFDEYTKDLLLTNAYYTKRKFLDYKKKIIKYFTKYIEDFKSETNLKKIIKNYQLNKRQALSALEIVERNIITSFEQNVTRAFGQAMFAIEKRLGEQESNPGFFGVSALARILGISRRKLDEPMDKLEGLTRLAKRNDKTYIYKIQIVPYLILLIVTAQIELHRQANEVIAGEAGIDLGYISPHPCWLGPSAKEICNLWRDRIVSITGLTAGFPKLEDALKAKPPLFHPNCTHSLHTLTPEAAAIAIKKKIKKFSTLVKYLSQNEAKSLKLS